MPHILVRQSQPYPPPCQMCRKTALSSGPNEARHKSSRPPVRSFVRYIPLDGSYSVSCLTRITLMSFYTACSPHDRVCPKDVSGRYGCGYERMRLTIEYFRRTDYGWDKILISFQLKMVS